MSKTKMVGTRVPIQTVTAINDAIKKGQYLTPSDLIRSAIERELNRLKVGVRNR